MAFIFKLIENFLICLMHFIDPKVNDLSMNVIFFFTF